MKLKEIRERIDVASEGPWGDVIFLGENRIVQVKEGMKLKEISDENSITKWEGVQRPADAHFMAHARQDVPELLDAFEEALGLLDYLDGRDGWPDPAWHKEVLFFLAKHKKE